ncbi:MAG: ATP-dependent DNA helicase [Patescibacteria group bacterium]
MKATSKSTEKSQKNTRKFDERYAKLNPEQKTAVDTVEGPVLVIAGPGSGKTEILSMRVANILKQTDTSPGSILCLTFTESASLNMRERLSRLIGKDAYRVGIYTFHGFCTDIISRFPEYFFGHADFHPADDVTRMEILSDLFREMSYDNPLRSEHPDQGFVFLKSSLGSISDLKRAGITPDEFSEILKHNEEVIKCVQPLLTTHLPERLSKKEIPAVRTLYEKIQHISCPESPLPHIRSYKDVFAETLLVAIHESEQRESSAPLSEWKKSHIVKDETGQFTIRDTERMGKMQALADLYRAYQKHMYDEGYFDFDDMILEVIKALEEHPELALDLQERFQYILIDEFQDTNDAQMRLVRLLTSAHIHEGRPNIMAVGDDDQSIYKFQGAEIANILLFTSQYTNPKIVTLGKNYRSTQDILDISESVISQGTQSLRVIMPEIEKKIIASNTDLPKGEIHLKTFETELHEYEFVAHEIQKLVSGGVSPDSIAVISRKHESLLGLVPFLYAYEIPVHYEKRQNVLANDLVRQLVTMVRFVATVVSGKSTEEDEYLPQILSFPFWKLPRKTIWEISIEAHRRGPNSWITTMQNHSDPYVRSIADFLLDIATKSNFLPLERVLDLLIGSQVLVVTDSEYDDEGTDALAESDEGVMKSPFREYYFSLDSFKHKKTEYIVFLSALKTFIGALREYRQGRVLTIRDLISFVDVHEKNGMELLDQSPHISSEKAVNLVTAHKAKGLEYDVVFVLSANDEIWSGRGMPDKLKFPININARPSADSIDDKIRLLYVALTRAKHTLYVTHYEQRENGKKSLPVEFLSPVLDRFVRENESSNSTIIHPLETSLSSLAMGPYATDEISVLKDLVKSYQMSVTHLNNFLDVSRGGPAVFLEQNLLRFPQAKTVSNVYGTAMHSALQFMYTHLKRETVLPETEDVLKHFEKSIRSGNLHPTDEQVQIARGRNLLTLYIEKNSNEFNILDKVEVDFKHQGVTLGDGEKGNQVCITGKIDTMSIRGDTIFVTDYKTGKPFESWEGADSREKIKIISNKRQLMFYKILVEGSRDYSEYVVERGQLQFLEPVRGEFPALELQIDTHEVEILKQLIEVVYCKIVNLDFPDITKYSPDYAGCMAFAEDLLSGVI